MSLDARASRLFLQRWYEQLHTSFTPRRARTLSSCAALEEVVALADSWLRSGGQTKPAIDPEDGGHGVQMLPDVAAEAETTLSKDVVLTRRYSSRREALIAATRRLKTDKADDIRDAFGQINALLPTLRYTYIGDGFEELQRVLENHPDQQECVVRLAECIVSELRAQGWTDAGLLEAYHDADIGEVSTAVTTLAVRVCTTKQQFECYVGLALPAERPPLFDGDPSFQIIDALPEGVLEHMLGDKAKLDRMITPFYSMEPLLVFRAHSLWKDLGGGSAIARGKAIAEYHERSRQRIAWEVGRIYRARNRIAHIGVGPERLKDLVSHAHFYLTQLIAICVHYNETEPIRAQDLLTARMGQYQAYIELLRRGDPTCLEPQALLRPALALEHR